MGRKLAEEKEKEEKKEKEEIENSLQSFALDDVAKENCDDQDRDLDNGSECESEYTYTYTDDEDINDEDNLMETVSDYNTNPDLEQNCINDTILNELNEMKDADFVKQRAENENTDNWFCGSDTMQMKK